MSNTREQFYRLVPTTVRFRIIDVIILLLELPFA